jgi:hypothetical protein
VKTFCKASDSKHSRVQRILQRALRNTDEERRLTVTSESTYMLLLKLAINELQSTA